MELRQLKYFVKVGDLLNFSEAARTLCVSQSTLSQQVKSLEEELGCRLLSRDSHSVSLTEEGRFFLEDARAAVLQAQKCQDRIRDLQNLEEGTLRIGCTRSFGIVFREAVLEFMRLHPNVKLCVEFRAMDELLQMLRRQEIDFALSYKPNNLGDDIESHVLFDSKLCLFLAADHPFLRRGQQSVTLQDLQHFRLALPAKGMQARNVFDRITANQGCRFDVGLEINEVDVLLQLVRHSQMGTILSRVAVADDDDFVRLPIEAIGNNIEGCFHVCAGGYVKRSVKEFIRIVSEKNVAHVVKNVFFNT